MRDRGRIDIGQFAARAAADGYSMVAVIGISPRARAYNSNAARLLRRGV